MPVFNLGHGVALIPFAACITVHHHLCTPITEEDAEYLRRLDPASITVQRMHSFDPEWAVTFSDRWHVELGVRHHCRFRGGGGPANTLRPIATRSAYLAK